jgi:hypothetical protein
MKNLGLRVTISGALLLITTMAHATTLVVAMDNSSSTMENRQAIAKQCSDQFLEAMHDQKINKVYFMTIGSAKNPAVSESRQIGQRDYAEYMTRDTATAHFKTAILGFSKKLENGKIRLDNSSAIYNGIFFDAAPLFRLPSGASPEEGSLIVCSDFIENEIVEDITKKSLPPPPNGALRNIHVFGIGIGLGLDSVEQNSVRDHWSKAMRQAGADFVPLKVR